LGALKGLIWRSDATRSQHRGLDCFITKNLPEMGQDRAGRIIHHLLWQHQPGQAKDTMPFGSPGYAAPEQYGKTQTTPQSDLYSLGALLHQVLSGDDPAETPFRFAPLRLYGTTGLAELEALIMRMVEMDPRKRPASTAEVKEELRRIVMFRMLRTNEEPRLWRPGQPQDLPSEFPPPPWQAIPPGSRQQQQQIHVPRAGPSRRKVLLGGLVAGAALVAGTEGLVWLLRRSGPRSQQPTQHQAHQAAQVVYRGHTEPVRSVAWSPDSQFIASTGGDNTVQVWQAANGKRVTVYDISAVHAAAWSPNGRLIAFADGDALQGWDPFSSNSDPQFSYAVDPQGTWSVAWSPDGERIAVGSLNGVEILDAANGQSVFKHDSPYAGVTTVTWSPDGRSIAWGSSSYNTEEVWEVATNRRAYIFYGPRKDNADGVAWSPDGKYLISAIAWSPDGTYLAFGSAGAVVVRETAQWSSSYAISGPVQMVNTVAWSPDSKRIASAGYLDPRVQVWDATDGEHVYIYGGHSIGVRSLAWSPDGKRIASGGIDQTVQVWEPVSSDEKTIAF
jgi:serine/threonine protein kinase